MNSLKIAPIICAVLLAGCSSSALMVDRAPVTATKVSTAKLEYVAPTIGVEDGTQAYLRDKMAEALVSGEQAVFSAGDEITIRYQFVGHNEGSRAARWLTGGLAGGSKTYIQAEFVSPTGEVLGRIRSEGSVGMGIAGGSAKSGIDAAVKKIASYAAVTFKR